MSNTTLASDRYRVIDRIGEGGVGVVHRVEDRITGEIRAMKVIPRTSGVTNLRGEFLALARLSHPNIVRVHDYGLTEAGHDYFTMDYVEGPPLASAVAGANADAFYPVTGAVLRALAFLHSRGMVHADIKPSNILIDAAALRADPVRGPRLVDFGLAADLSDPAASAARGTFPYAAPEVYAGRLDARSDLYSVGVVLYELATRQKPFAAADVAETLRAQRRGGPIDPRELAPQLPDGLAELILGLLDPAPGARPQTADEVLARINDIAGTSFAIAASRPLVDISSELVGRDRDLAAVDGLWEQARDGRGGAALVCGEEGIGKSRLLAELKLRAQLAGGRAYRTSVATRAGAPYAGLAELVRGLLADVRASRAGSGERRHALAPLFGAHADVAILDPESRYALAEAVVAVVLEAAAAQPLLIEIDDVERADAGTIELLVYLARACGSAPVLLVLAVETGREAIEPRASTEPPYLGGGDRAGVALARLFAAIDDLPDGHRVDLPPLDRGSVYLMVQRAFGDDIARALAAGLHRSTGGNPAHAAHALQALVDGGTIARERGRWLLKEAVDEIPMPAGAVASALGRAEALGPDSLHVLRVAAVLGERFRRDLLMQLIAADLGKTIDVLRAPVNATLAEAVAAHLIGADVGAGWFHFLSGEVASELYAQVDREARLALHGRAAGALAACVEAGDNVPPETLAAHYVALDDDEGAAHWALQAARVREAVRDAHGALYWYDRARPLIEGDRARLASVDEHRGDLCALLGDTARACEAYRSAFEAAREPPDRARLARQLAEMLRRRGSGDAAVDVLMRGLDESRTARLPRQEALCHLTLGYVLWYRADYKAAMEHAIAGHVLARAEGDRVIAAQLGKLRSNIEVNQGNPTGALHTLEEALADIEADGSDAAVAEMQYSVGRASIPAGDYARAISSYEKAIPVFERVGRIEQLAKSFNNLGVACYFQGDWRRARESWEQFRDLCARLGDDAELVNALNNLGFLYRDLGELSEALAAFDRAADVASRTGHAHMAANILGNRGETLFRQADLAGARQCYETALAEFEQMDAREDVIENRRRLCELDIGLGRYDEAVSRAIDTIRVAQDAGLKYEEGILHRVAASALRHQGDIESAAWFCERSRELLGTLGARFERAKVDLESGEIAAAQGDVDEAERMMGAAINAFVDLGARWHLNRARGRRRALRPGETTAGVGAAPLSPGKRDVLLDIAKATARLNIDQLLNVVLDKLLELTEFDRGFVLLLDDEGRPRERMRQTRRSLSFHAGDAEFSGSIVRRVAASGEPVAVTDIADDIDLRNQASVISLGLRQVMCVPMHSRGRVIGIIYVDSRRLPHEDDRADMALLEALSAQAAVAIENARLISEERRKTELMGILAHEIRNPLAGILGFSSPQEIESSAIAGEARELLGFIHRDAQRLKRLVDNVLELTRHESGEADWSVGPFAILDVIENVRASYLPQTRERDVSIDVSADPQVGAALGNPDRVTQVVSNLVGNAVKFAPKGSAISIAVTRELIRGDEPDAPPVPASDIRAWAPLYDGGAPREYVRVDVVDRGPGMSEDIRTRLFEKFSQGEKRSKGIGLGLYISREIIDRHGGSIWVHSEPGEGAQFSFRIPAA